MSLDVDLERGYQISYDGGKTIEEKVESVFDANITHNLNTMADKAGIYKACWRPEEIGATTAKDIGDILEKGYADLVARPSYFKMFNPENGWGTYEGLVSFVKKYLEACRSYPDSVICISR